MLVGIPRVIFFNNGKQFDNDRFEMFCSDLIIAHHFSSPGHPQANGQVEVANKMILRNLKTRMDKSEEGKTDNLP